MDYEMLANELLKYAVGIRHKPSVDKLQELSKGEMAVIAYLTEVTDTATPGTLSKQCCVSTARIANTLNSLEKKDYVIRTIDPKDRRKIIVHITDKGKAYGMQKRIYAMKDLTCMLKALGEQDAREYVRICRRIYELSEQKIEEEKDYD